MSLDEVGLRHGTDKASCCHAYTPIYEIYFAALREEPIVLLEFGVGGYGNPFMGGESLRMWADWFPNGTIIGVDDQPKELHLDPRVRIYRGDQADKGIVDHIVAFEGQPDIVIDDASHISALTIATFRNVWPHIKPGGLYICEDLFTSYDPGYGGNPDPDAPGADTAVQFFRRMVDEVNYTAHYAPDRAIYPQQYNQGYRLAWAHFWQELVILRKKP